MNIPSQESMFFNSGLDASASGAEDNPGLIDRKITLGVSYMEIYNESVNDLLDSNKTNLELREHKGEVFVDQLTTRKVVCSQDIIDVLHEGDQIRKFAETKQNAKSSRSHTVFRISVEIDDKNTQLGRRTIRSSQI